MSVGGIIVDVVPVRPDKVWVNTLEPGSDTRAGRTCSVYCDPAGEPVAVGDALWWQSGTCYWTPADRSRADVKLRKIGFSGVPHPEAPRCPKCDFTLESCQKYGCGPEARRTP